MKRDSDSASSTPLLLQRLSGTDQALALLHIFMLREARQASTRDLLGLIDEFRLPRPANMSTTLARLERKRLVRRAGKMWQLTPAGEQAVATFGHGANLAERPPVPGAVGSPFGGQHQDVVPHWFAPTQLRVAIARILEQSAFDQNVLLISRFPSPAVPEDPLHRAIEVIREALADHGLHLHMASDRNADDGLFGNVTAHMWACRYGVAILEDRHGRGLNQNVLVELGAMNMTGRRCALLRDNSAPNLPSDLLDRLYRPFNLDDSGSLAAQVHRFARDDLRLSACGNCPRRTIDSAAS